MVCPVRCGIDVGCNSSTCALMVLSEGVCMQAVLRGCGRTCSNGIHFRSRPLMVVVTEFTTYGARYQCSTGVVYNVGIFHLGTGTLRHRAGALVHLQLCVRGLLPPPRNANPEP